MLNLECTNCGKEAVYEAKYNGTALCRAHFTESVEHRVKQELRAQIDLSNGKTDIAVAVSGGKDSSVTLHLVKKILGNRRDLNIWAFTVDEGIEGYRNSGLASAAELCRNLGIPHRIISNRDIFGVTLDEMVKNRPETIPCSMCGPMRRQLMDRITRVNGADYVALGINLDDYAQSIMMNVARGDVDRMLRMAPHTRRKVEGMTPRILPLRRVYEKEVLLYAILNGVKFDSSWCPYYERAQRNTFREILTKLEERTPGVEFAIANFGEQVRNLAPASGTIGVEQPNHCKICGAVSSGEICSVCLGLNRNVEADR
ncbi:MAG TPA: TIGR00269 family protein [Thermoplasmataceae archaeon]|nr:TIGR00269 family protein [Thermoplasmataceae archaeon]